MDGTGHSQKCRAGGMRSHVKENVYAQLATPLFKVRIENPNDRLHVLNKENGTFSEVLAAQQIQAHEVKGVFDIRKVLGKYVISFNATAINRFSIAFAYFLDGAWRLRFRMIVTHMDGVIIFPLCTTFNSNADVYTIPTEYDLNTALVLGIDSNDIESHMNLRIFANASGVITDNFNGIVGHVSFNKFLDKGSISNTLSPKRFGNNFRFSTLLYTPVQSMEQWQRNNDAGALGEYCHNCLVPYRNDNANAHRAINTVGSFRLNVYGQVAFYKFDICIGNPNDKLHVLDKATGTFKMVQDGMSIQAHAVAGIFNVCKDMGKFKISFEATARKCFNVCVAYYEGSGFALKYVIEHTLDGFVIDQNPRESILSDVLVLGIQPASRKSSVRINDVGTILLDRFFDRITIDGILEAKQSLIVNEIEEGEIN